MLRVMAPKAPLDLPYSVEQWDNADQHVEELIALVADYRIARAAFDRVDGTAHRHLMTKDAAARRQ